MFCYRDVHVFQLIVEIGQVDWDVAGTWRECPQNSVVLKKMKNEQNEKLSSF